jgi:predicted nucleic acid-binding protein
MSRILIDSSVLLDILGERGEWTDWSESTLKAAADVAPLVINPVVYAEISIRFSRIEDLDEALASASFEREPIPYSAAFLAGKAHLEYRRRGGSRPLPLPDFFIGAHAAVAGYRLLTRDISRIRTYFPSVVLFASN